jgi:hypothetical protein
MSRANSQTIHSAAHDKVWWLRPDVVTAILQQASNQTVLACDGVCKLWRELQVWLGGPCMAGPSALRRRSAMIVRCCRSPGWRPQLCRATHSARMRA